MLLGWLAVAALASVGEWWTLSRAQQQQQDEVRALFLRSFPENKDAYGAFERMQKGVERLALRKGSEIGSGDLLGLLGLVAPVLQAEPRARVKGIAYAERALTLTLTLADNAVASSLAQALRAAKLEAETGEAQTRADGVEVRMVVRAAATGAARGTP